MKAISRGEAVAREARAWIGTPFVWGQSQKQVGCDCKGLVQGVARELGFHEAETFYATFSSYRPEKAVPVALLKEGMGSVFEEVAEPGVGDVLLLLDHGRAQHLGICCGDTVIHAQGRGAKKWVKETRLEALTRLCQIAAVYRWRD